EVDATDLGGAELQLFKLGERGQALDADIPQHRMAEIERLQSRQLRQVRQADVGHVCSAQAQFAQVAIRPKVGRRGVGNEFGGVQVQLFQLLQLLEMLDADIGHIGERQIETL